MTENVFEVVLGFFGFLGKLVFLGLLGLFGFKSSFG
jgi:hypothetical protein